MKRSLQRFLQVFPLISTVVLIVGWLLIEAATAAVVWRGTTTPFEASSNRWLILTCMLLAVAILAGSSRAVRFHPAYNTGYRDWLARAGWSGDSPLPFGPVQLVPADLVFPLLLGLFTFLNPPPDVLLFVAPTSPLWPAVVFLISYNTFLWMATPDAIVRFLCLALLPLTIYPSPTAAAALLVQATLYGILIAALRRDLRQFPWRQEAWTQSVRERHLDEAMRRGVLGWPYNMLGPHRSFVGISMPWAVARAGLAAWWTLAILLALRIPALQDRAASIFLDQQPVWVIVYLAAAGIRLAIYNPLKYLPARGIRARIATRRWIVPGYDQIFLSPLLVIICGWWGPEMLAAMGVPAILIPPVTVFAVAWSAVGVGPSLEAWHYTGAHRLCRAMSNPAGSQPKSSGQEVRITVGRL